MPAQDYVPDEGHVLHLDFGPVKGHEQDGKRFGVVLSPALINRSGMCIIVPLTTRINTHRSSVKVTSFNPEKPSVALCTQVTAIDWQAREAEFKGRIDNSELYHIRYIVKAAVGPLPVGYKPPAV